MQMTEEEKDVQADSSPAEESSWKAHEEEDTEKEVEIEEEAEAPDGEEAEPEKEATDAVEKEEPEPDKPKEREVPLSHLIKERKKRQEYAERLAELEAKLSGKPTESKDSETNLTKPKLKDFEYDEAAYEAALDKYNEALIESKIEAREKRRLEEEKAEKAKREREEANKKLEEFYNEDAEYQSLLAEVMDDDIVYPKAVAEAVREYGPMLDKAILKNRDVLLPKLEDMSERMQLIEIGKLISELESPKKKEPAKQVPKTKAPPPIKPSTGGVAETGPTSSWIAT